MRTQTTRVLTFFLFFLFLLCLGLALASSSSSPAEDRKPGSITKDESLPAIQSLYRADAVLFVTGSTRGEFEPCGCGGVFEGGFARRSMLIHKVREINPKPILLDTGDTVSNNTVSLTEFVFHAYGRLGYDAVGLGEGDLRAGLEVFGRYAKKYNLPFVASNLKFKSPACVREVIEIERVGHKIGIISLIADGWLKVLPVDLRNQLTYEPPDAALERLVPRLRKTCDTIILISHLGTKARQALMGENERNRLMDRQWWTSKIGYQSARGPAAAHDCPGQISQGRIIFSQSKSPVFYFLAERPQGGDSRNYMEGS